MNQKELENEVKEAFVKREYISVSELRQKAVMHDHTWFVQKENRPPVDDPVPTPEKVYRLEEPR